MLLLFSGSLLISLSLALILSTSPLAMGFWVLLIALVCAWTTGVVFNSWFSIIIFLVYIGGMLVMFAYFSALTPNQPLGLTIMIPLTTLAFIMIFLTSYYSNPLMMSFLTSNLTGGLNSITFMFNSQNSALLLLLASILFFILVAVVKITNISFGPLRPFM
uniref:NADH dehydrogenase subunit 6 n=1 Tax=Arctonoe vittata TaxID=862921 RepID=A0A8F2JE34_9ANNE|nr:NADH dehydrogenase subunit 6 [Arctonoe vittata]